MKNALLGRFAVVLLLTLICAASGLAATAIISSDEDLVIGARAIIVAKVLSNASQFDSTKGEVFTYTTLKVSAVLKGELPYPEVVVKEEGGTASGRQTTVPGTPKFTQGEHVLLYLDTRSDGSLRVHEMFLGRFSIGEDASGTMMVSRGIPASQVDIKGRSAGTITDKLELTKYVQMVRQTLRANADRSNEFQAKYYKSIPMLQCPREYTIPAAGEMTPEFTLFPSTDGPSRWFEPDSGQPVPYVINLDQAPLPNTVADISAAMQAWMSVPGTLVNVTLAGTANGSCYSIDGPVLILFDGCDDRYAPTIGCAGILGMGGITSTMTQTTVVNGTTFNRITSGYMSFNPYSACSFTTDCDLQEVATHEMGHSLGLGHSWQPGFTTDATPLQEAATMFFSAHFDGRCATVETDDINGITFLYPASSGGLEITNGTTLPAGTVGASYSLPMTANGTPPYSWAIPKFKGQLPPGLALSPTGAIAGVPSTTGTFSFTLEVTDSASHAAQAAFTMTISQPALALVTSPALPYAIQGTAYTQQLAASGGMPPYSWSMSSGTLPKGLTLSGSGVLSGTPTAAGSFSFGGSVTDSAGSQVSAGFQIQVISPTTIPRINAAVFKSESAKLTIQGEHFDSKAVLMVDGTTTQTRSITSTSITAKLTGLASGTHQASVVNSNGIQSNVEAFTVK